MEGCAGHVRADTVARDKRIGRGARNSNAQDAQGRRETSSVVCEIVYAPSSLLLSWRPSASMALKFRSSFLGATRVAWFFLSPTMRFPAFVLLLMLASPLAAQTVVVVEKPEFRALVPENATLETVATGFRFTRRPGVEPARPHVLTFSDIPGEPAVPLRSRRDARVPRRRSCREPSNHANGNTLRRRWAPLYL